VLIALAIAGAPVAMDACQVMCSSERASTSAQSCHEVPGVPGSRLSRPPHTCSPADHDREAQPGAAYVSPTRTAAAIPLAVMSGASIGHVALPPALVLPPPPSGLQIIATNIRSVTLRI